jgi:hypothetical protein
MYRAKVFATLNLARLLEARFERVHATNFASSVEVFLTPRAVFVRTVLQMIFPAPNYRATVKDAYDKRCGGLTDLEKKGLLREGRLGVANQLRWTLGQSGPERRRYDLRMVGDI